MAVNKKYIIGIDIGGSKINAIIFNDSKILKSAKIPTPKSLKEFLEKLESLVGKLISASGKEKISGIGCGVAGILDLEKGIILKSPNIRFLNNFNIKNWLYKKFNCEVKIDNDARCFTRAEFIWGAGKGHKNVVGITLGTGIGGGIIVNGQMFYGANGSAGELGHMVIHKGQDFEALTVKLARKLKFSKISGKKFENNLAIGLANIINILDPEVIILGGRAGSDVKFLLPKIKKTMNKLVISPKSRKNVKILIGELGENAGAIGAVALFYE